eukprot:s156_g8.t1
MPQEEVLGGPDLRGEVEAFLAENPVDHDAAEKLRAMSWDQQFRILDRGSLRAARNPSAVLAARMKEVESGGVTLGEQGQAKFPSEAGLFTSSAPGA